MKNLETKNIKSKKKHKVIEEKTGAEVADLFSDIEEFNRILGTSAGKGELLREVGIVING